MSIVESPSAPKHGRVQANNCEIPAPTNNVVMAPKKVKPQGEFAWVMDGKTEYFGQLVEPISAAKTDENQDDASVELEVQWTHNGKFEWVTLDRVRVETSVTSDRERSGTRKAAKSSTTKSPAKTDAASPQSKSEKKRSADKMEPENQETAKKVAATPSTTSKNDGPPSKKRKTASAADLFASITSQVVEAKNSFVSGMKEVYNELVASKSSS